MFFDENIIKILYQLPEEADVGKEYNLYLLGCLQCCSETIIMYKLSEKEKESEFNKISKEFNNIIMNSSDIINYDKAFDLIQELEDLPLFNLLFQDYINSLNRKIVSDAKAKDPLVIVDLERYINTFGSSLLMSYVKTFIQPQTDIYQNIEIEEEVQEMLDSIDDNDLETIEILDEDIIE